MTSINTITDIHVHILPGIDDGPESMQETQTLIKSLRDSGVHRAFCTSHYANPHFDVTYEDLETAYNEVLHHDNSRLLTLSRGAEVRVSPSLIDDIKANRVPTLGETRYVLVEFPGNDISNQNMAFIYELKVRGYIPIMAHPERNLGVQRQPQLINDLIEAGLFLQLTADCFLKPTNHQLTRDKLAWRILEQGQASLIASDAHNTTSRAPLLLQAYEAISAKFGEAMVSQLIENANAVWEDASLNPVEAVKVKKRVFGLF